MGVTTSTANAGATYVRQVEKLLTRLSVQDSGCWHHPTKPHGKGYAATRLGWPEVKSVRLHKVVYEYFFGKIENDMVLDHLCHDPSTCAGGVTCEHRRCVNPAHLALVTASENNKKTARVLKYRTHCKNGHSLENNIYKYKSKQGERSGCAICMNRKVK